MNTDKFFRRWRRRYLKLLERQWVLLNLSRIEGRPEQVHDLRVTLRRLRLMLRLAGPSLDQESTRAYRAWSRRVADATSPLRDHDVTLDWLANQPHTKPLVTILEARRHDLWKACRQRLKPPKTAVRLRMAKVRSGRKASRLLDRRYRRRMKQLHAQVATALPRFFGLNIEERHDFRRALRKLRYLRELVLGKRKRRRDKLLLTVDSLQSAMGNYQDLRIAEAILSSLRDPVPAPTLIRLLRRHQTRGESAIRADLDRLLRDWSARSG
jgi:CHAD domain-containing protein